MQLTHIPPQTRHPRRVWRRGLVRRPASVVGTQARLGILHELQYRGHAVLQVWATLAGVCAALIGIATAFQHTDNLGGWNRHELVLVVGLHLSVGGFIGTVIKPSLQMVMEQVREGTFDYVLIRPVDSLLLGMTQNINPWRGVDMLAGFGLIAFALANIGLPSAGALAGALAAIVSGVVSLSAVWVLLTTLTFRFVRVGELLDIAHATYEGGRWPVGLQVAWLRALLVIAVPVGVAVSVPAGLVTGDTPGWVVPAVMGQAIVMAATARLVWMRTIRSYSGASA